MKHTRTKSRTRHPGGALGDWLPALLVGVKVRFEGEKSSPSGIILEVGRWYGPGRPHSQAMVRWHCKAKPGQLYGSRRPMPHGLEWEAESAHYVEDLEAATS